MGNSAGSQLKDACADCLYLNASHNLSFLSSFYVIINNHICNFLQALLNDGVTVVEKENYTSKSEGLAYN